MLQKQSQPRLYQPVWRGFNKCSMLVNYFTTETSRFAPLKTTRGFSLVALNFAASQTDTLASSLPVVFRVMDVSLVVSLHTMLTISASKSRSSFGAGS